MLNNRSIKNKNNSIWQEVIGNHQCKFDLAVFEDNENTNTIISDFVSSIQKKFQEKEGIEAEIKSELDIWTLDNIYKLCLDYLTHAMSEYKKISDNNTQFSSAYIKTCATIYSMQEIHEQLINNFIKPIKKYIQSLCSRLSVTFSSSNYSNADFREDANLLFNRYVHLSTAKDEKDALAGTNFRRIQEEERDSIIRDQKEESRRLQNEIDLATSVIAQYSGIKLNAEETQKLNADIASNEVLRKALIAAYQYLNVRRESCWSWLRHGKQGRKATQLFIEQIITLPEKTEPNIQDQALQYIKAEGIYSSPYGEASGPHNTSRIGYIINSGILDNIKNKIGRLEFAASKLKSRGLFCNKSHDDRVELLEKVKCLSLKLTN